MTTYQAWALGAVGLLWAATPARAESDPDTSSGPTTAPATEQLGPGSAGSSFVTPEPTSQLVTPEPAARVTTARLEDMSLQELLAVPVAVASKRAESAADAPAVVTVVTRDQILRWGYQRLSDILRDIGGFYIVDDHALPNAGTRGIAGGLFGESANLKVLLDGNAVTFETTGGHWLGDELVPITSVQSIEIVSGPASAIYGANAFLAVINIITRKGDAIGGAELLAGGGLVNGKLDEETIDGTVGFRHQAFEGDIGLRLHQGDRPGMRLPDSSPAPARPSYNADATRLQRRGDKSGVLTARLTYHVSDATQLTLLGYYSTFSRRAELAPWAQLTAGTDAAGRDNETRVALAQGRVGLELSSAVLDELTLRATALAFWGGPEPGDRIEVGSDFFSVRRRFGFLGGEARAEVDWRPLEQLTAGAGVEYIFDREQLPEPFRVLKTAAGPLPAGSLTATIAARGDVDFHNVGAFVDLGYRPFGELLQLRGSLRFDDHTVYGAQVTGRASAVSRPLDDLTLKLIYANAFKAPSPFLLEAVPFSVGDVIGNPRLAPQYVHQIDFQTSYAPWAFLTVQSTLSYAILLDIAEFQQQGVNRVARNVAQVRSLDWNSEVRARYSPWLDGYLGCEIVWAERDRPDGDYIAQLLGSSQAIYPPYVVRAGVSGEWQAVHLRLGVHGSVVGPRQASDVNSLEAGHIYSLPAYVMLRAVLSWYGVELLPGKPTGISLTATNLLNTTGPDPGFAGVDYPLAPLTLFAELRQEL